MVKSYVGLHGQAKSGLDDLGLSGNHFFTAALSRALRANKRSGKTCRDSSVVSTPAFRFRSVLKRTERTVCVPHDWMANVIGGRETTEMKHL